MDNLSYLNDEDEEDVDTETPYSSISDRVPSPDFNKTSNPVSDAILKRRGEYQNDPLMDQYNTDRQQLDAFRGSKNEADLIANLGQSFQTLAQGSNAPKPSNLYEQMAKQNTDGLKSKEGDLDRRSKIVNAIESRKMRQEMEQGRREDRGLVREQIAATRGLARSDKKEKEAKKLEDRDLSLAVPGYERTGEVLPKPEEAAKLRGAAASAEELSKKLGRLKELVTQYGSFERGGTGGAEMESLATEIQLLAKNQDMYNLGVLTGPDMSLLTKITADPGSMDSLFTRDSTRQKQIDTQLSSVINKLNTKAKSMGYRKKEAESDSLSKEQNSGSVQKTLVKKQYSPSRDQTKLIYEDGSEEIINGKG